jgi:hypothetical protein
VFNRVYHFRFRFVVVSTRRLLPIYPTFFRLRSAPRLWHPWLTVRGCKMSKAAGDRSSEKAPQQLSSAGSACKEARSKLCNKLSESYFNNQTKYRQAVEDAKVWAAKMGVEGGTLKNSGCGQFPIPYVEIK